MQIFEQKYTIKITVYFYTLQNTLFQRSLFAAEPRGVYYLTFYNVQFMYDWVDILILFGVANAPK